jgi:hypothetical protein
VDRRLVIGLGVVLLGAVIAGVVVSRPAPMPPSVEGQGAVTAPATGNAPQQRPAGDSQRTPLTRSPAEVERTAPMAPLPPVPTPPTVRQQAQAGDLSAGVGGATPDAGRVFGLSRDGIRGAFASQMAEVRDCYSAWLAQNPSLAGTMLVGFEIAALDGGGGGVTKLEVLDGGLGHALMEGCVLNALAEVRFEEPDEPLSVHYPLQFSASRADGN